jgi:hypothetical protein
MLSECHRSNQPGRELGRSIAAACELPGKGRTTDVLTVLGRERGISRKKAVRMARTGQVRFLDATTVSVVMDGPPGGERFGGPAAGR